jgi:adenylylsulfate kinase
MMSEVKATNIVWHGGGVSRAERERLLGQRGVIVWMTGLSGAGKSTIACEVEKILVSRGRLGYRLDGDNVRHGLCANLGFSAGDRAENIRRVGEVAKLFLDAGVIVIVSFISPYRSDRELVRKGVAGGEFVEVYIKASLAAAEGRDPKGLYKKARRGEITGFTGIDDPYEEPENAEVVVDTERVSVAEGAAAIVGYLERGGYLG